MQRGRQHVAYDAAGLQVDAGRARAYVLARGGMREKARLDGIFGRQNPDPLVVQELAGLQNPDGGFPVGQTGGAPSSIETTCDVLAQLKDIRPLAGSPMASRALAFLRRSQQTDGSWRESAAVADKAPHRAPPTSQQAAACLTANASYMLITMEPGHLDPVARGERFLRQEFAADQVALETCTETLGLAAAIWYRLLGPAAREVAACYSRITERQLTASQLSGWLSGALEVGAGGRYLLPLVRMVMALAQLQQPDGGWASEDGVATETTLQALRVLQGYGVL